MLPRTMVGPVTGRTLETSGVDCPFYMFRPARQPGARGN